MGRAATAGWRGVARALLGLGALAATGAVAEAQLPDGQIEAGLLVGAGATPVRSEDPRYLILRTLGFLLTDAWAVGVALGLAGDFDDAPTTAMQATATYHLAPERRLIPYVGVHAGVEADILTRHPRVREVLGPAAGVKWQCWKNLLLIAEVRYALQVTRPERGVLLGSIGFSLVEEPQVDAPTERPAS